MPLFQIQDADRPMYVVDDNFSDALEYWREFVALENDIPTNEVDNPIGVRFVCDDDDLIVNLKSVGINLK